VIRYAFGWVQKKGFRVSDCLRLCQYSGSSPISGISMDLIDGWMSDRSSDRYQLLMPISYNIFCTDSSTCL